MKKTIRCIVGTTFVLSLLVLASIPVQATDRDCGDCEARTTFLGQNNWQSSQYYNDSDYSGPYVEWWDNGDNLNFTLELNVTNQCGLATDFEWTIELDAESRNWNLDPTTNPPPPHCFAILGGDNSPVYDEEWWNPSPDPGQWCQGDPCEDTIWVAGLANGNTDVQTVYIEVYNTFYFSFVDIGVEIEPYRNGSPVGSLEIWSFEWDGFA